MQEAAKLLETRKECAGPLETDLDLILDTIITVDNFEDLKLCLCLTKINNSIKLGSHRAI